MSLGCGHQGWARVRPSLSGICGSDLGVITGSTSLYFAALASMPYVPGHELVGTLLDDCEDLPKGTRVVLEPVLACAARGLAPCDQCADGRTNLCDRITVGHVAPGLQTGFCSDTGGGWGEEMMAHRSQLHPVPDSLSDERAVLVEPLACAVQLARRAEVPAGGHVLVSGAGAVGLFATLALRELTPAGRITVVAKHSRQRELARLFGATDVAVPDEALRAVRRSTRALRPATAGLPGPVTRSAGELLLGGRRRRRRRGRLGVLAGPGAALDPRRRPGRAVRHAGGGRRPVARLVPRARGGRHVRRPRRRLHDRHPAGRRGTAGRCGRRPLPAAPLAGGAGPRPVGRPAGHREGLFRRTVHIMTRRKRSTT